MKSINQATEEVINKYDQMEDDELQEITRKSANAQQAWKKTTFDERAEILNNIADLLEEQEDDYAELMTSEMGKPLPQGRSEAEKCAWVCRYYADNAEEFLADEIIASDAQKSYIHHEPLGTVLAIMPWNFPFWQLFRFGAPALMAGNAVILKHASNVIGCALAIEELMHKAGIPESLFRTAIADDDQTQMLIRDDNISAITLTGSTRAGKAVSSTAGEELKKTVLELGGSDPYVILDDADIAQSAETCVNGRLTNSGQSCIAAKRFIVTERNYDAFINVVVSQMKSRKMGDPTDEDNDIGPMARIDLRDKLHKQVQDSIEAGAECILGGQIPDREGAYYPPTILANISEGMPAYNEELFGPVASVIKVEDEEEAIRVANDSDYGLGAAIFSEDGERAERIAAEEIEAGCCFINEFVKSDPRLPFGGVKQSGYGRELSHLGIREFVNQKTVYRA